ncbi:MAG: hypothetical protein LBR34_11615, partial [Prevotella sp.]|nr:hypothetical protein [Prevotella sp.]
MKRLIKSVACAILASVAVSAQAQVTPEAVLGKIPPAPSAADLVKSMINPMLDKDIPASVTNFNLLLENANRDIGAAVEKEAANAGLLDKDLQLAKADEAVRRQTGKSLSEIQGMSEADARSMGEKQANDMLRQLGINKDVSQLQNMSEADAEKMAGDMVTRMTGMSMSELQALENMSEQQQLAYMQQNGRLEKLAAQSAKLSQLIPPQSMDAATLESLSELQPKMADAAMKIHAFENEVITENAALRKKAETLFATKYAGQVRTIDRQINAIPVEGMTAAQEAQMKALHNQQIAVYETFYNEIVPWWIAKSGNQRDKAKSLIADGRIIDEYAALSTGQPVYSGAGKALQM